MSSVLRAELAAEHLRLRLGPINRALRAAAERQAAEGAQLDRPDLTAICVTDRQVQVLLDRVDALVQAPGSTPPSISEDPVAARAEEALRGRASTEGIKLPLDELADEVGLGPREQAALLVCAAPEVDRAYERIFAYVLDDLNRRYACAELLCTLMGESGLEAMKRLGDTGRYGRLRRLRLLRPVGEAPTDLRQELALAPGVFDFLMGRGGDVALLAYDPAEVAIPGRPQVPPHVDLVELGRFADSLRNGSLHVIGVWGPSRDDHADVVFGLAHGACKPLRRLTPADLPKEQRDPFPSLRVAVQAAAVAEAILWIAIDSFEEELRTGAGEILAEVLGRSRVPVCLSGSHPWRPTTLVAARPYAELQIGSPGYRQRRAMWSSAMPEIEEGRIDDLAARYRLGANDMRAVASIVRMDEALHRNGDRSSLADRLDAAAATVARKRSDHFATIIAPGRKARDLVLPDELHRQVVEIASFFRAWPRVAEDWGFSWLSGGGIKALFTGDPGTGKTLAAEVIAGILGLTLLRVDLARVVSKWVGETEKNLEAAFQEAADSHSVLLFDEADALFGKRGEVRHGTDRYANLEVGYLLQRLEEHEGLVILASNLGENIDPAFTRRFHFIIHFPRPGPQECRQIWRLAFPAQAPLGPDVDLTAFADLDMTGASIAAAARTAALLAAERDGPITMAHIARAVSRQFHQESRLLRPDELGAYAALLEEG